MMTFIHPRLRKPLRLALLGTVVAAAWLVRGGSTRWIAIFVEVGVLGRAIGMYVWGGEDTDDGALAGSRADERQKQIGLRSRALSGTFAMITSYTGLAVAIATRLPWWPFAVILAVTALGYLFGLSTYGVGEEEPADDADDGYEVRAPAGW
jgi:hypothetical protein